MRHPGRHYLGFADDFEQRFIGQGARRRGLTETLDLAWAPLGRFSRHELTRIRESHLDRHHPGQIRHDPAYPVRAWASRVLSSR